MKLAAWLSLGMLCGTLLLAGRAAGQIFDRSQTLPAAEVEPIDATTATHLENARRFLAEKQWEEAVDAIRRGMDGEAGRYVPVAELGPVPEGFQRLIPVREFCQWRLAALATEAPEALAHYRSLADPLAEQWLAEATQNRDERLLQRLVSEALSTTSGDDALLRLGDAALARGQYAEARGYFGRIGPHLRLTIEAAMALEARPGQPAWRALQKVDWDARWLELAPLFAKQGDGFAESFPDSELPAADVRARLVLTSILEGNHERAEVELELFRRLHAEAQGQLTGREGNLAQILTALLTQSRSWPPAKLPADWPTFAGDESHRGTAGGPIDPAGTPLWTLPLPKLAADREVIGAGRLRVADDKKGLLSYHPVIVGDTVLIRVDARLRSHIVAIGLHDGEKRWQVDSLRGPEMLSGPLDNADAPWEVSDSHDGLLRHVGVARHTLTVCGNKLFARMGSPVTAPPANSVDNLLARSQGFLMGYDLATEGKPLDGFPIRPESGEWSFEGTPVCDAGNLYVAMRRVEQGRCQLHVACFALTSGATALDDTEDNARPAGRLLWRTKICSAATLTGGDLAGLSHCLLTLDGTSLLVNTNLGVIAMVAADGGHVQWLHKYPRANFRSGDPDRHDDQFFRDLTPCLPTGDLVICAPADCDRLFALDRTTGAFAWATPPGVAADAIHLLGTSGTWLLASGDRLYWIDLHTGQVRVRLPDTSSGGPTEAAPNPRGFGRGILAGDEVYWPTRESILVYSTVPRETTTGFVPVAIREIPLLPAMAGGGNLVFAHGVLLIAAGDTLYAFEGGPKPASAEP
jgi:hypothetical protein